MRETMRDKCSLYVNNYLKLKRTFKWEYTMNHRMGALLYTMENRGVDVDGIKNCREFIKANTDIFSYFRSNTNLIVSTMVSLRPEPDVKIRDAVRIYESLKREGFHSSPYLVFAAITISIYAEREDQQNCVTRAKAFYDAMKTEHRFLTTADDYTCAALMALSKREVSPMIREMESCYHWLKSDFRHSNAVQSLAQVLSYSEEMTQVKGKRVVDIYQALKVRGLNFGRYIELPFLGVVSMLPKEISEIADEIAEVNCYLKKMKGFGAWSISAKERLMFAAALVCDSFLSDASDRVFEGTLSNITTALIISQATTIAVTSVIAANAAASSAAT